MSAVCMDTILTRSLPALPGTIAPGTGTIRSGPTGPVRQGVEQTGGGGRVVNSDHNGASAGTFDEQGLALAQHHADSTAAPDPPTPAAELLDRRDLRQV